MNENNKNSRTKTVAPQAVSNACKSLIQRLLEKQENQRLGSKAGASEVKAHPFFKSLKFALLRHMTPPIVPGLSNSTQTYRGKDSMSLDLERDQPIFLSTTQDPFCKFNSGKYFFILFYMRSKLN